MSDIIVNTNERAVSADINRLQTMLRTMLEESFRWQYGAATDELEAAGVATVTDTVGAPPQAVILNGIMGSPGIGAGVTTVSVTPGALYIVDTDTPPNADASPFKLIVDNGSGPIPITPNTSGSTRVDVLECQRNPGVVIETSSRDVFNGSTGLFNATTVNKVEQDQLTYRIRAGSPGLGYPGTVTGWLPLMLCVVPTGFTTNDVCVFIDVRPLGSDLEQHPFDVVDTYQGHGRMNAQAVPNAYVNSGVNPTTLDVFGVVEVQHYDGRKLGGNLSPNGPAIDVVFEPFYVEPGFTWPAATQGLWYVYLATYFGLPRWAVYTSPLAGVRKPSAPRGLVIFSLKPPDSQGRPVGGLVAPPVYGLNGASTFTAKMVLVGTYETITNGFPIYSGCLAQGGEFKLTEYNGAYSWNYPTVAGRGVITILGSGTDAFKFTIEDATYPGVGSHPITARSVKVRIQIDYVFGPSAVIGGYFSIFIYDQSDGSAAVRPGWQARIELGSGASAYMPGVGNRMTYEVDLPLYLLKGSPVSRDVYVSINAEGDGSFNDIYINVIGWTLQE